jgi:carboxyl-terminal processing protease
MPRANNQLGQLKLTIAKFYRINGSSTQHRGVIPDVRFPSIFDRDEIGESAQEHALPWDEITPIRYRDSRIIAKLIPEIRRRHQARVQIDPMFKLLLEDIEEAKRVRKQTAISLLESKRRAERSDVEARRLERENKLRRLQGLKPLTKYDDITQGDGEKLPDPLVDESVNILADLIALLDKYEGGSKSLVMTGP